MCRAIALGEEDAAEVLLAVHGDALKKIFTGSHETTALHKAIEMGNLAFVKRFTELRNEDAKTKHVTSDILNTSCNGVTPLVG